MRALLKAFSQSSTCVPRKVARPELRQFSAISTRQEKQLPPRKPLDENEITESFLQGSGPGGQKINRTSSAVQLHHGSAGVVVKCQQTRSRIQNRKIARRLLQDRLEELELGEASRTKIKAEKQRKKNQSADKKKRRKYRQLEKNGHGSGEQAAPDKGSDTPRAPMPVSMSTQKV